MTSSDDDLAHILALEKDLLRAPLRHDQSFLDNVLADEFVEFGKSERSFNKAAVIAALRDEGGTPTVTLAMDNIQTLRLSADVILLTYALNPAHKETAAIPSLRSSIWTRRNKNWQLVFHQGTPAAES
jgi:hypothetical protein